MAKNLEKLAELKKRYYDNLGNEDVLDEIRFECANLEFDTKYKICPSTRTTYVVYSDPSPDCKFSYIIEFPDNLYEEGKIAICDAIKEYKDNMDFYDNCINFYVNDSIFVFDELVAMFLNDRGICITSYVDTFKVKIIDTNKVN